MSQTTCVKCGKLLYVAILDMEGEALPVPAELAWTCSGCRGGPEQ